ncbi:MAG: arabinose isomerase [Bacteroidales bacterium]|nr:arabinose isomerase [Bacteroidales bacterium]
MKNSQADSGSSDKPVICVFGVGYDKYWEQFEGLLEKLMNKHRVILEKISRNRVKVIDFGMVDNPMKAYEVLRNIESAGPDLVFCTMLTYATSGTFGIIIKTLSVPVVLIALQPLKAMDYANASTFMQLSNDDICALPEFASAAIRMGKRVPETIIGTLHDDPSADSRIDEFCRIANVLHGLKNAHIGHIGHPLNSMLDMHTDITMLTSAFGCHVTELEANELLNFYHLVTDEEVAKGKGIILDFFDTPDPVSDPISLKLRDSDLETSARIYMALRRFVEVKNLHGLAYYYDGMEGSEERLLMSNLAVGNSILISNGFPMCGESDLKTLIALFIMDRLGFGGSFAEFHPADFNEGFILVGHDGPHNIAIASGRPVLRSLKKYHGKPGFGAGVEFRIREGPITLLSVNTTFDGRFKFILAEGESVSGPIPATGNTNTRSFFKPDIRTFLRRWLKEGPTHHFALGVGHHASTIRMIAEYLNIESSIIAE